MKLTSSDSKLWELFEAFFIVAAVCGLFLASITGAALVTCGGTRATALGGTITGMLFTEKVLTCVDGLGVLFSFELSVAISLSTSAKLAPCFL